MESKWSLWWAFCLMFRMPVSILEYLELYFMYKFQFPSPAPSWLELGSSRGWLKQLGPCHLHGRPRLNSSLSALAWFGPGSYGYLETGPGNGHSLCPCLSNTIKINKAYFGANIFWNSCILSSECAVFMVFKDPSSILIYLNTEPRWICHICKHMCKYMIIYVCTSACIWLYPWLKHRMLGL